MVTRCPLIAVSFIAAGITIGTILGVPTPTSAQQVITCESYNNRGNSCAIPTRGRVRLVRQLSNASCRDNWGFNRNRIWVRNGCRAQFVVGDRRMNRFNRYNRYDRYDRDDRFNRNDRYDRDDRYDRYDR